MIRLPRFSLLAAIGAGLSGTASGTRDASSIEPAHLTVYSGGYEGLAGHGSGGFALIRQPLQPQVTAGANVVRYDTLPRTLDVGTVALQLPSGLRLSGQRYEFASAGRAALIQSAIGQTVTVEQFAGDSVLRETGVLLAGEDGLSLRLADGRVRLFGQYANIELPALPSGSQARPTLVWQIDSDRAGQPSLTLDYATGGLAWRAEYRIALTGETGCRLRLDGTALVVNRSGIGFRDARLTLVAGEPNQVREEVGGAEGRMRFAMAAAPAMAADQPQVTDSSEYHAYPLPRPVDLPDGSIQHLPLLTDAGETPCRRSYRTGNRDPIRVAVPMLYRDIGGDGPLPVTTRIDFDNDRRAGLGIPLPAGRARVFEADGALLGEVRLGHTAPGTPIELDLGEVFDLSSERSTLDFRIDRTGHILTERLQWTVRNGKSVPVQVRVEDVLPRWSDWEIIESEQGWDRVDAQQIAFDVMVPAEDKRIFSYTVRYRLPPDTRYP